MLNFVMLLIRYGLDFETFVPCELLISFSLKKKNRSIINCKFLSADSFSSALLVVSSKGGWEMGGREGELFDKFFCSIHFSAQARHLGFESGCMP